MCVFLSMSSRPLSLPAQAAGIGQISRYKGFSFYFYSNTGHSSIMANGAQNSQKALATVVLVTKDEYDLVDDFLSYHSALFGAENVVVVDNGSTDERLKPIYRRHREAGVRFILERREFTHASDFMSEHMRALAGGCRFLLPLETDEFIYLMPDHPVARAMLCEQQKQASTARTSSGGRDFVGWIREAVHEHLLSLPEEISVLRYGAFLGSCVDPSDPGYSVGAYARPAAQITRFKNQDWDKLIIRASAFDRMTVWCHHAAIKEGASTVAAKSALLGLLHFHDTGRRRLIERATPVVRSYRFLDLDRDSTAEQLAKGREKVRDNLMCGHKLEYMLDHLARLETLRAFRRYLGRLPATPAEMERYSQAGDDTASLLPDAAVRADLASGSLSIPAAAALGPVMGWDELLYHESKQPGEFVVRMVSDALQQLPPSPSA
jgi:hypothetical protein